MGVLLASMESDQYDVTNVEGKHGCSRKQRASRGLGRKLLDQVVADLKDFSVSNVKLACSLYANPGKETFYEKFGFQKLPNDKYGYGMLLELS